MPFLRSVRVLVVSVMSIAALLVGGAGAVLGVCGPFTDVSDATFCPFVLEVFTLGITTGTSPTTYDPASAVSRLQMAAFLSRTVDRVLDRGSRRAALKRFYVTQNAQVLGMTTLVNFPQWVDSDGTDLWVTDPTGAGVVWRVRGSDGKLLETWTGSAGGQGIVAAMGRVVTGGDKFPDPGALYVIDPKQPAGAVTTVATNLGIRPRGIAFDGGRIWTANLGNPPGGGSVSIVVPGAAIPWSRTNVSVGFSNLIGVLFDGSNVWVTDGLANTLLKLDPNGAVLQTVTVGLAPQYPVFDGTNIWVPNGGGNSVSVVRASSGAVLTTLTANGMNQPVTSAFDGQRVLVTNLGASLVSLWKAADLTPIGSFGSGGNSLGACSDGLNFWFVVSTTSQLARF
jgi:hypothetical protein